MRDPLKNSLFLFFLLRFLLVFFSISEARPTPPSGPHIDPKDAAVFFAYASDRIQREYVEDVSNQKLLEGALNGMLMALDPHSSYLDPKTYHAILKQAKGEYGGLGLEVFMEDGLLKVISAIDDTPAQQAHLEPGDWIIFVDDKPTYGMTSHEASDLLRGKPGTQVKLTLRRGDNQTFDRVLTRSLIRVKPVKWHIEKDIGYIRITTFNEHTPSFIEEAVRSLKHKLGSQLIGYVIDVRNNSGGLFPETIDVVDSFLSRGEIVSIRGRTPKSFQSFSATSGSLVGDLPLVVLINGGSASASEILAGALQDHGRAIIVGTKSFGKGSVQTVIPMTNGGAIKITTARYFTPSGRNIQKTGIIPDIVVEQQRTLEPLQDQNVREVDYRNALDQESKRDPLNSPEQKPSDSSFSPGASDPSAQEALPASQRSRKSEPLSLLYARRSDFQLAQALNVLRAMSLQKKTAFRQQRCLERSKPKK